MMKRKLLLIGGGGHCKSILDALYRCDDYEEIGIVERDSHAGSKILETYIVGTDDDLPDLFQKGYTDAFVSVGSVGDSSLRHKLYQKISDIGFHIPNIIDPTAGIGAGCHLEAGVFVGKRAIVNADTVIEKAGIINTGAVIEHDCRIGAFAHVAPGAVVCGNVSIGGDSHIGANATVIQGVRIGEGVTIGAGSVVVKSVPDFQKYCGVPARKM